MLRNCTTYSTYYRLANGLGPEEDPELPKGKAASALARWVSLHPRNIAQRAEVIVEHIRHHTASKIGGRAKAMVVTPSRLHAVRYDQAITAYLQGKGFDHGPGAVGALVAFSGTLTDPDNDTVTYRESVLNGFPGVAAAGAVRRRGLPGPRRRGEVPDGLRPAAAAHHVRREEARVGQRRSDVRR